MADSIRVVSGDGQSGSEVLLQVNGTGKDDDYTVCLRHKLKMVSPSVAGWFMIMRDVMEESASTTLDT